MSALKHFVLMGGYGFYVWGAYGFAALLLAGNIRYGRRHEKKVLQSLKRRYQGEQS